MACLPVFLLRWCPHLDHFDVQTFFFLIFKFLFWLVCELALISIENILKYSLCSSFRFVIFVFPSTQMKIGILLPKLFWPTVRKTFEIRGWRPRICKIFEITRAIYSNSERSEHFLVWMLFWLVPAGFSDLINKYNSN